MGTKLTNAPVYYTVAQVQFNPVLDLDAYIPAIQSKMREAQFPDFKKHIVQQLVFPFGTSEQGQAVAPSLTPQSRYLFGDIEGRSLFLLEANTLSFQTTSYDTFETFSGALVRGLDVVHQSLRLDFVERIGLRYLDAVQPGKQNETLKDFLVPEVLGLALRDGAELHHSVSETSATTIAGQLTTRVVIRHGNIGLPMDLAGFAPHIAPRFTQHEGLHAILDTDASVSKREPFAIDNIDSRLIALHVEIGKSFKAIVTKYALEAWA